MKHCILSSVFIVSLLLTGAFAQDYTPHQYQQNDWFLDFGENTAQYVNPASIAENDQIEISGGIFSTLSGNAGQEFLAIVHPFDYNHSVGFTFFENGAALDEDEEQGYTPPAYIENAYQLGYAYRMGPSTGPFAHNLSVGLNVSMIQFSLFEIQKFFSFGADLGLSWNPVSNSRWGHLQFGLAVQNVLQPKVKLSDGNGEYDVPMNANISGFWRLFNQSLELAGSASLVNLTKSNGTVEAPAEILPLYSGRMTYFIAPMLGIKFKYSKQGYPVVGGTVRVKRVNLFRYLQFDLDLSHDRLSTQDRSRGIAWNLKAVTRVGPTREERIGAARYRRLKLEPEDAYREAMRLYLARKFLLASYAFGKVITKYPAFHLVDLAAYYKGKSFENLRMHKAAKTVYNRAIKDYSMSDAKPRYIFQLMNIDYKERRFKEAAEKYQLINNLYKESDIKPDADYVMGQILFMQDDYSGAIRLLKPILPGNANYVYARYTLSMCYFKQKKNEEAVACLKDITEVSPSNISEQELQDIASVKLGHFAFDAEPPRLLEAAKYYNSVSPTSSKYDEALLGLAWSFLKAQKFDKTAQAVEELLSSNPNSLLAGEALLLRGYCYYFEKDYKKALESFDKAIEKSNAQVISESEKQDRKSKNQDTRAKFESVQDRALSLSDQIPSARVLQKRDELRPEFEAVQTDIEQYVEFLHQVELNERFVKNRERVVQDAKYTKATVQNIMDTKDEQRGPSQQDLEDLELE